MIPWLDEERAKVDVLHEYTIHIHGVHYCHITPSRLRALIDIAVAAQSMSPSSDHDQRLTMLPLDDAVQLAEATP